VLSLYISFNIISFTRSLNFDFLTSPFSNINIFRRFGFYMICFDMAGLIDPTTQNSALEYIKHWVYTLLRHAPNAKFCFVGTHRDAVHQRTQHEKLSQLLFKTFAANQLLASAVENKQDELWLFPLDNTIAVTKPEESGLRTLQRAIDNTVQEYGVCTYRYSTFLAALLGLP
jgi:hypothetical protein